MRISVFDEFFSVLLVTSVGGAALPVAAQQPLRNHILVEWEPGQEKRFSDRGIGVAHLRERPGAGTLHRDTILLWARPDPTAEVTGAFLYTETQKGNAWRYSIAAPIRIEPNVLEFAYEEAGVPLDSLTSDAAWGRVLLGFDTAGAAYRGWVRLDLLKVNYRLWSRELTEHNLFFLPQHNGHVLDRPGGRGLADISPAEIPADYILHPLEARGAWLRVRLTRPADTCGGPKATASGSVVGWTRYLDDEGRPLVWYYTRGC